MKHLIYLFFLFPFVLLSQTNSDDVDSAIELKKEDRFQLGVVFGANLSYSSKFVRNRAKEVEIEDSRQVGFQIAGAAQYVLSQRTRLEARLGLLHSGLDATRSTHGTCCSSLIGTPSRSYEQEDTISHRSTWFEVPLILRFRPYLESSFYFEIGANIAIPFAENGNYAASYCCLSPPAQNETVYDSGNLKAIPNINFRMGFGFYFKNDFQVAVSWSRVRVNEDTDSKAFPIIDFPLNQARLDVGWYF